LLASSFGVSSSTTVRISAMIGSICTRMFCRSASDMVRPWIAASFWSRSALKPSSLARTALVSAEIEVAGAAAAGAGAAWGAAWG
jgi:hypothetical protein